MPNRYLVRETINHITIYIQCQSPNSFVCRNRFPFWLVLAHLQNEFSNITHNIQYTIFIIPSLSVSYYYNQQMTHNFKSIKTIPASKDLINIVLSKTQRKTPTVVHPGYNISRIRTFYMRKIKFCAQMINERLDGILQEFPRVEEVHPFYGDLINVLYDKDHYKLALGHVKSSKNMIENLAKDYLKLSKYADSLYRCKSLKKAALGRMCTILKKISASLAYLEEVRKHLARIPSIQPFERTILVTGYPNVGKSSFVNSITKANVQVQPYPFTTQALYVGHSQYKNLKFQVIDSPGILDHPLEQMNTIEMQSVTALAHLKSCILYFVDLSEQCGYSIREQMHLYENIKPLFKNKPLLIVLNKIDLVKMSELQKDKKKELENWLTTNDFKYTEMSALEKDGTDKVKEIACELLMASREGQNLDSISGGNKALRHEQSVLRGLYVAQPKPRDNIERRAVSLPRQQMKLQKPNFVQLQEKNGGAGVFSMPIQEHYILPEEWKYDQIPEIMNGKNIADFVDPEIWQKLEEIEREEDLIMSMENLKMEEEPEHRPQFDRAYKQIQEKKHAFRNEHLLKKSKRDYKTNKSFSDLKEALEKNGVDTSIIENRLRNERSESRARDQMRSRSRAQRMDTEQQPNNKQRLSSRIRQESRSRSRGYKREDLLGEKLGKRDLLKIHKQFIVKGKVGEADRHIAVKKPKHLFSGKTSNGARDRR